MLNNVTADVTDNNYYMYKDDIARIAALGVKVYSFSLSWSRILPFGRGPVNELAIAHYNDVINTCIEYNVIPMVTLYVSLIKFYCCKRVMRNPLTLC